LTSPTTRTGCTRSNGPLAAARSSVLISLAALGLALLARFGRVLITSRGIYDPAVRLKHGVVGRPPSGRVTC
jgi:hypothetical protein